MKLHRQHIFIVALVLFSLATFDVSGVRAQKPAPAPKQPVSRPEYSLRISTKDLITLSLKAEKALLSKIAGEISKKLKVPVLLGPSLGKREVTTDFKDLTLEPAMNLLAPQVYIDYEINQAPGMQPQPVGIYLNGYEDPVPPINSVIPNRAQAILIEGHTEEGVEGSAVPEEKEEEPLRIVYERNALTVKAKKQVLSVVLYKIASELGIPLEIRADSAEVVDLDINNMPIEDAILRLSPHVRLYVRADLQRLERRPFRMVLVAAEKG